MALRQTKNRAAEVRAYPVPMPAPVGGWNTRDSLTAMPKQDAVILTNWWPDTGNVSMRNGHAQHATGMTGNVETLAEYNATTVRKLIAAANGNIWDATSAGAASSLASGFASDRWQWANFNGSMGLVNGADAPQVYNGSAVSAMTVSGSGLSTTNLVGIHVHKSRSYFWESNSQDFWYSATNALGGTLTKFPLSRLSQAGGNLVLMITWTIDGGNGTDDLAVFMMSSGEAFVYQGSDPGSASDWSLVGRYMIGAPLSIRSAVKVGGDVRVITRDDYVSLSEVLKSSKDKSELPRTKAVGALKDAVASFSSNFGWQALIYGNMLIFNVPMTSTTFEQHVRNVATGAWCRFTGWNARCFGLYNNQLYFGGSGGIVYKADTGTSDNNAAIQADAMPAWSMLGVSQPKQVTAVRNLLETTLSSVNVGSAVGVDFNTPSVAFTETSGSSNSTPWGSPWGSSWSASASMVSDLRSANGYGTYFSQRMRVSTGSAHVSWNSYVYLVQPTRPGGTI